MHTFNFNNNVELPSEIENKFCDVAKSIAVTSNDVRVIAITSTQNQEGKTFTSSGVARALAKMDYRVILLMADMRKTTAIEDKVTMGIVDVINGKTDVEKAIYKTDIEGLDVMFSGATRKNEKLDFDRQIYSVMLKCLKEDYNYIIVDMATMGKTNNDIVCLREADVGILVMQPNNSSKKKLKNNLKIMEKCNCKVLGAVINNR